MKRTMRSRLDDMTNGEYLGMIAFIVSEIIILTAAITSRREDMLAVCYTQLGIMSIVWGSKVYRNKLKSNIGEDIADKLVKKK